MRFHTPIPQAENGTRAKDHFRGNAGVGPYPALTAPTIAVRARSSSMPVAGPIMSGCPISNRSSPVGPAATAAPTFVRALNKLYQTLRSVLCAIGFILSLSGPRLTNWLCGKGTIGSAKRLFAAPSRKGAPPTAGGKPVTLGLAALGRGRFLMRH
jgi:hypothetical protein